MRKDKKKKKKKELPRYGGARDLSHVGAGHRKIIITPKDVVSQYSYETSDEFKFLLSHYLDAVRRKKGYNAHELSRSINRSHHSFSVMKFSGVSTFEVFFAWCRALGIDPLTTLRNCLDLASHFKRHGKPKYEDNEGRKNKSKNKETL